MLLTFYAVCFIVLILMQDRVMITYEDDMLTFGLITILVSGAVIAAARKVVAYAGFGTAGVVAGSAASIVQANWFGGDITGCTGAVFAALQRFGAAGLGFGAELTVVAAVGATLKTLSVLSGYNDNNDKEDNNKLSVEF